MNEGKQDPPHDYHHEIEINHELLPSASICLRLQDLSPLTEDR